MDRLTELEVFTKIAEESNLSRAADALGISVSGVSRHLASLENRLGVRLVQRTTRQLFLTPEGESFSANAREILATLREAEASVSMVVAQPRGTLRVGASLSFALLHLMPVIREFRARHPLVQIDLKVSNRYQDLVESGLDLAIRTRRVEMDSSVTIRKLAETRRLIAAAPAYLRDRGTPAEPRDLLKHDMLLYSLSDDPEHLNLARNGELVRIPLVGQMVCNDGQVLRQAALDGLGIIVQPAYIIHADIKAGRLVRILADWELPRLTMNLAFPSRSHLPARTRLFINALVEYFSRNDFEAEWDAGPK
ncbi:DNA-binding transcriptional LysR family regulator [Azospirillum lipoferum]|uniref:LysR family transcriptional regulator n=1 Tax=Azospirillum lipoferum TaxID=193 RepID=A0A5A9GML4_AZOLI|nr:MULTISPECIES: LysR family transcriptional regulator [Azospirillum]KAA0595607.1 LysR family transcriptional regulator [Azospirillum lipoferum]MCP1611541.1 DNA-binding transcriptional LysR family regulator [Azospirillum lipoferum]MDW5537340.1 LysR family transcriptional regulator [Azospirillum sp. NL1]